MKKPEQPEIQELGAAEDLVQQGTSVESHDIRNPTHGPRSPVITDLDDETN